MFKKFNILFVTFFYIGKIKVAPGTFASFFTCILMFFLINLISFLTLYIFTFLIFLYSLYAIKNVLVLFKEKDPKDIVIDEFIGQALPLLLIPIINGEPFLVAIIWSGCLEEIIPRPYEPLSAFTAF